MVTLTMVPDRFENRATAHLKAFKQRKQMMAGGKPISANSGTLTCVLLIACLLLSCFPSIVLLNLKANSHQVSKTAYCLLVAYFLTYERVLKRSLVLIAFLEKGKVKV